MEFEPIPSEAIAYCRKCIPTYASTFNQAKKRVDAKLFFHPLCSSLAWTDELPQTTTVETSLPLEGKLFYQALLSMRTRKIVNPVPHEFDDVLDTLKCHANEWAFFDPERFDPKLRLVFFELEAQAIADLENT